MTTETPVRRTETVGARPPVRIPRPSTNGRVPSNPTPRAAEQAHLEQVHQEERALDDDD